MNPPPVRSWLLALALASATTVWSDGAAQRQALFAETVREVDTGGQVLLFCNTDELLQNAMTRLKVVITAALGATPANTNAAEVEAVVQRMEAFLGGLGLRDVRGVAYSAVPRADGLNNLKLFLNRTLATGTLWRVVGTTPRQLKGVDLLPRDTVFANLQNVDLAAAWQLIRDGVRQIGGAEALAGMDKGLDSAKTNTGINISALLGALGDELLVSVQLSSVSNVMVMAGGSLQVYPRPSALLGFALRDVATVRQQFASLVQSGLLRPLPPLDGVPAYALASLAAQDAPFPLAPVFMVRDDFLLIASQPDVALAAVTAARAGNGLAATPGFRKAFADLPMQALNGLIYLDPKLGRTAQLFQAGALTAAKGAEQGNAMLRASMEIFPPGQMALVRIARPNGMALQAVASFGGRDTVASLAVMPVALMTALVLPGVVKGRHAAQRVACLGNLRQLDMAKEQWAIDKDQHTGAVPKASDLAPYLKTMPACPLGGVYKVGPVGQPPCCNLPDHALQPAPLKKRRGPTTEH